MNPTLESDCESAVAALRESVKDGNSRFWVVIVGRHDSRNSTFWACGPRDTVVTALEKSKLTYLFAEEDIAAVLGEKP